MLPETKSSNVWYSKEFTGFLNNLVTILYLNDYFGFIESAKKYTADIITFIEQKIHILPHHTAPEYFSKYQSGMKYIAYQANKRTTWYIFFKQSGNQFLIYYITNNHFEGQYMR
ncbi:MAG: hypothetical protein LC107_04675 [Chitinophagales bacterium]|nr:hypothetical protein [Chitinophagales bacterium]